MAGTITHSWNGTVLTITSDAGTSSCDLKGAQGDMGVRGAQGAPGVIYDPDGNLVLSNYASIKYVDDSLESYATKGELNALKPTIAEEVLQMANICYVATGAPTAEIGKDGDICIVKE